VTTYARLGRPGRNPLLGRVPLARFQKCKNLGKMQLGTVVRLNPAHEGEKRRPPMRRNLRVHEGALRVNLRLGRSTTPVFMPLLTLPSASTWLPPAENFTPKQKSLAHFAAGAV